MDALTLQRIKLLHPAIRQQVLTAYEFINNKQLGKRVRLRFAYTLRSLEEQEELYAQGRTKKTDANGKRLRIVTNAKAGQSTHNYGLAFDIVLLLDLDDNGTFETASWDIIKDFDGDKVADWMEVVKHFKSIGFVWGGDWTKFIDNPHFEKTFGHTWRTLKAKYDSGDTFTEVIDGKTYKWVNL
jgi:peptidoglycan L-alanyl-D-glutamate endopeptidase CwlK